MTFSDNTDVFFELDPGVKVTANYAAWKKGDQHMIKSWPQRRWFWQ